MKQGTLISRIVMLLLLVAVVTYLGFYAWDSLSNPFSTFLSYPYTVEEKMEATGFLVRQEQVIPGTGTLVDLTREEGERVSKGADVAVAYQSPDAAERQAKIHALELELEQLQYAMSGGTNIEDGAVLSQQALSSIAELKASVASGNFTRLEEDALKLKSLIYRREYTYAGVGVDGGAVSGELARLEGEIAALKSQSAYDTTTITVPQPGIFSGLADGYEMLITPAMLEDLTPADLDRLSRQRVQPERGAVGKLITDNTWYYTCVLEETEAKNLWEGRDVTVRFSRDWSGEVPMTVDRMGEPRAGRCVVVLSSDHFLSQITLLRHQSVEIVYNSRAGIRVPSQAIRVVSQTQVDEATGEEITTQVTGVYALVGIQAEFKPVTVLQQRDDYCIVAPVPEETEQAARKELRPGDEIIVAAADLFDGKVVR